MQGKTQLIQQIIQSLRDDDMISLNILFQDEDIDVMEKISSHIQDKQLLQTYKTLLQSWRTQKSQNQTLAESHNKIRQIQLHPQVHQSHSAQSSQQQNIMQQCLRIQKPSKPKLKLQQHFGYAYYGNIKCLMIAYGDLNPSEEAVKMMHSQLEVLFEYVIGGWADWVAGGAFGGWDGLGIQDKARHKCRDARTSGRAARNATANTNKSISNSSVNFKKPKQIPQKQIKRYLEQLFRQEYKSYLTITKQYKKVAKSTKNKQDLEQGEQYSLEEEQFQQSKSESECDDLKQQKNKNQQKQTQKEGQICGHDESHMKNNTKQEVQYFAKLTKNMNQQQYHQYIQHRSINFLTKPSSLVSQHQTGPAISNKNLTIKKVRFEQSVQKMIKFLDQDQKLLKPEMSFGLFELLSFICCRVVRRIVFGVIRSRNSGALQPIPPLSPSHESQPQPSSITSSEIKSIGNTIIDEYLRKLQQLKTNTMSTEYLAKRQFCEDLTVNGFRLLMPRGYSLGTFGTDSASGAVDKSWEEIWGECAYYREMWMNRVAAQRQIARQLKNAKIAVHPQIPNNQKTMQQTQLYTKNEYTKYIIKNFEYYIKQGRVALWKKYFTQQKILNSSEEKQYTMPNKGNPESVNQGQGKEELGRTRKKVKLESLKY